MEPIAFPNAEISASIGQLLTQRQEHSQAVLTTFRDALDGAWKNLHESFVAPSLRDASVSEVVERLTTAVAEHISSVSRSVQADADARIKAAAAETEQQRQARVALAGRLEEIQNDLHSVQADREAESARATAATTELERRTNEVTELSAVVAARLAETTELRSQLEARRTQADVLTAELGQERRTAAQAESARVEMLAALERETSQRVALEEELRETRRELETTGSAAEHIRQKGRAAAKLAAELIAAWDLVEPGPGPVHAVHPPRATAIATTMFGVRPAEAPNGDRRGNGLLLETPDPPPLSAAGPHAFESLVRRLRG